MFEIHVLIIQLLLGALFILVKVPFRIQGIYSQEATLGSRGYILWGLHLYLPASVSQACFSHILHSWLLVFHITQSHNHRDTAAGGQEPFKSPPSSQCLLPLTVCLTPPSSVFPSVKWD